MAEPNNTLIQATNINRVLDSRTIRDFVGDLDTNDFFRFNIGSRSSFNLSLTGLALAANPNVQLLNSSGGLIAESTAAAGLPESITQTLNAGNYAIRVFQSSGNTFYNLNVSATPFDFAGNTRFTARNIGPVGVQSFFQDAVTNIDTEDIYRFQINPNSSLRIRLNNLAANADLELLDKDFAVIRSSGYLSVTSEEITLTAAEVRANGTEYFVRVKSGGFRENTAYNLTINGSLPDLAGSTIVTARNIGNLNTGNGFLARQSFVDFVNFEDSDDFYQFTVGPNSNLTASLSNLVANANLQILDNLGRTIDSSSLEGTFDEVILNNLAGGIYFARVFISSGDTSYQLSLSATQPDFAGNTRDTALNFGTLNGTRIFNDEVTAFADNNDFYQFSLTGSSIVDLALNGLTADANLSLLNSSGVLIATSALGGTTSESISRFLDAGTYFVRVNTDSGATLYNLSLSSSLVPFFDLAGNTAATARNIGPVGVQSSFRDRVSGADPFDFYRFIINPNSSLNIVLNGLSANADLRLFRADGAAFVRGSFNGGITPDSISLTAAEVRANGTEYVVRVESVLGANTAYNLTLNGSLPDVAGNTTATARNLGNLNGGRTFIDFINSGDTNDFYQFTVGPNSNLTAKLDNLAADADLQILNAVGVIGSSSLGGTTAEQVNLNNLAGGLYFARVLRFSGDTSYRLDLSATQPDFAGNTLATALNFGELNGSRTFNDQVINPGFLGSLSDSSDFYRFTLGNTSNVSVNLTGLTADADVRLLNRDGILIASSAASGTTSEFLLRTLASGTYYVEVNQFSSSLISALYNLRLTAV